MEEDWLATEDKGVFVNMEYPPTHGGLGPVLFNHPPVPHPPTKSKSGHAHGVPGPNYPH